MIFIQGGQQPGCGLPTDDGQLTTHAAHLHASLRTQLTALFRSALSPESKSTKSSQVRSGQARPKSSQIKSTPTRQQIGILNRFLSTKVGHWDPFPVDTF